MRAIDIGIVPWAGPKKALPALHHFRGTATGDGDCFPPDPLDPCNVNPRAPLAGAGASDGEPNVLPWGKVGTEDDRIRQCETRAALGSKFSTVLCCEAVQRSRARMERKPALVCGAQSLHIQLLVCIAPEIDHTME
jgi:hypothetical protein